MPKQFNPFPNVSCRYGAPMGRHGDNPANLEGVKRLHCRGQGGDGYYDKGGAYWGASPEGLVYGVWGWINGEVVCCYVRAKNRQAAIDKVRRGEC